MQKKLSKRLRRSLEKKSDVGKTDLYRWLKAYYADLSPLLAQCRPGWSALAEEVHLEGVRGPQGQKVSDDAVRRVWKRLCRDIAESERARLTGTMGRRTTTRAAPGWQPPVAGRASTTSSQSTKPASPFAPTAGSSQDDNSDPYSPERLTAGLREVIAKRSGR